MITEFQDGFITKTKLNELVVGINENSVGLVDVNGILVNIMILTEDTTKTIGVGGDFTTLNLAIDWYKKVISNGYRVTLQLMAGFVMQEQVMLNNVNLGFVEIIGTDAVTSIDGAYITNGIILDGELATMYPAFYGYGSIMPVINHRFKFSSNISGGVNSYGIVVRKNSYCKVLENKGFTNVYGVGIGVLEKSEANIEFAYFSGSGTGCHISGASTVSARECKFDNCVNYGIFISTGSTLNFDNGSAVNCGSNGVSVMFGSFVNVHNSDLSGAGAHGIELSFGGGTVFAYRTAGTLSQTANTITANGIIFK